MMTTVCIGDVVRLTKEEAWFAVTTITWNGGMMLLNGRQVHPMDTVEIGNPVDLQLKKEV